MHKIKIIGLVLTLLLSFNGLAQNKQDRSDSEIVMTKAELESFLQIIAKKKRASLKKEKLNKLYKSSGKYTPKKQYRVENERSGLDRVNDRIDMLMQTLFIGNAIQGKGNSTIITSPHGASTPLAGAMSKDEKIAYLQSQLDSLKQNLESDFQGIEEGEDSFVQPPSSSENETITPERRSYLENLLSKYRGFKKQVFFENNSDKVSASDIEYIKEVANVLKQHPELSVLLKGYASPRGNANYNKAISMRRSENVLNELRKRGISEDRLEASFYGEDHSTSEAGARRVDMSVVIK